LPATTRRRRSYLWFPSNISLTSQLLNLLLNINYMCLHAKFNRFEEKGKVCEKTPTCKTIWLKIHPLIR
jgi:hypothetical protein